MGGGCISFHRGRCKNNDKNKQDDAQPTVLRVPGTASKFHYSDPSIQTHPPPAHYLADVTATYVKPPSRGLPDCRIIRHSPPPLTVEYETCAPNQARSLSAGPAECSRQGREVFPRTCERPTARFQTDAL